MTGPAGRRGAPRHVVTVDHVVVTGVPAAGLDPSTVTTALEVALPRLLAAQLGGGTLTSGRRGIDTVRLTWSPAAGTDALARALAEGLTDALRAASHE